MPLYATAPFLVLDWISFENYKDIAVTPFILPFVGAENKVFLPELHLQ